MSESNEGGQDIAKKMAEYQQLVDYAHAQPEDGFVWVYRSEAEHKKDLKDPHSGKRTGIWFTTNYNHALYHAEKMKRRGTKKVRVIAIAILKSLIDEGARMQASGGRMPVGTDTVLVWFRNEVIAREITEPIPEPPGPAAYINQFKIVSELKSKGLIPK